MNDNFESQEMGCRGTSGNWGQKLMYFMIGGGIGAGLALLFAPKPGREIREDFADLATDNYEKAAAAASDARRRAVELYETAKETSNEVLEVVSSGASSIKDEIANDVEKIGAIVGNAGKSDYPKHQIF